jgi:hypothetical protein
MVAALLVAWLSPAAWAARVTVVHGIPGFTGDVYVNGKRVLHGFQAGTMTKPLTLPGGHYTLAVRPSGAPPTSKPVLRAVADLPQNANVSVVAHLSTTGKPALSIYVNDLSQLPAGRTRLIVRPAAQAPPVDVLLDGRPLFRGVPNDATRLALVSSGSHRLAVRLAGRARVVWGPSRVLFRPGRAYALYAIGSLPKGTLDQLVQQFQSVARPPRRVPTGQSGLVSTPGSWWTSALLALSGLAILSGAALAAVRRPGPTR